MNIREINYANVGYLHLELNYLVKPLAVREDFNSNSMLKRFISWGFKNVISLSSTNDGELTDGQFVCAIIKFFKKCSRVKLRIDTVFITIY